MIFAGDGKYRVSEAFRPYATWNAFQRHIVSQVRRVASQYTLSTYPNLLVFEFFMPLTNEGHLRTALDALFFKDTVLARLRSVEMVNLEQRFAREEDEPDVAYLERICSWVGRHFAGYSISHVSGRFRADALLTLADAAGVQANLGKYLVDETTAIVRFIFPCGSPDVRHPPLSPAHFESFAPAVSSAEACVDAERIRWFFGVLFVQSIVQVVNGEDEVWMVESGMQNRLHRWKVESVETPEDEIGDSADDAGEESD